MIQTTKAQRKAKRLTVLMKIKKNLYLILFGLLTCILPFIYLGIINKGKEYYQNNKSEENNIEVYQNLFLRENEDKTKLEKKINELNEAIKKLNENINLYNDYGKDEQRQKELQTQINSIIDKSSLLTIKKQEVTNSYMALKQKYDIKIGDYHQNEENNEIYITQKDRNDRLKRTIEEMKKNSFDKNTDFSNLVHSSIITNIDQLKLLRNWISQEKSVQLRLIYSGRKNGDLSTDFHNKVDNISPTLSIIRDNQGFIYGGYTEATWNFIDDTQKRIYKADEAAFIFTLNTSTKYPINNIHNAILISKESLCAFGNGVDLLLLEGCINDHVYNSANFPSSYGDKNIKKNEFTNFNDYFDVADIEVFQIFK